MINEVRKYPQEGYGEHRIEFKSKLTDNLAKEVVAFLNYRDEGYQDL
jgi:predicted HTH transcriptional regulator